MIEKLIEKIESVGKINKSFVLFQIFENVKVWNIGLPKPVMHCVPHIPGQGHGPLRGQELLQLPRFLQEKFLARKTAPL